MDPTLDAAAGDADRRPRRAIGQETASSLGPDIVTAFIGNLFPPLSSLATAPIMAHALGVTGRGEVGAAMAPYLLLTTIAALGIPEAVTYNTARNPAFGLATTRRGLALVAVLGLIPLGAVLASANWLSTGQSSTRTLIFLAAAAVIPALCIGVFRGAASGLHRWRMVARERLVTSAVRLVAVALLASLDRLTPLTATVALAAAPIVGALAYIRLPQLLTQNATANTDTRPVASGLLRYGLRIWIGAISGVLLMRVDQLLMAPLAGTYQLGLYVVAVAVSEVPLIVTGAVRDVSFASQASEASSSVLARTARLSTAASVLVGLTLIALVPVGIPALFGKEFAPATLATIILIAAVVLASPGSVAGAGLSGQGRPGLRSASLAIASLVNLGLVIVMVPGAGSIGAANAMLVSSMVSSTLNIYFMKRAFGVPMREFYGIRRSDLPLAGRLVHRPRRTATP